MSSRTRALTVLVTLGLLAPCCADGVPAPRTRSAPGLAGAPARELAAILRAEDRRVADVALDEALRDTKPIVRARAVRALARIDPPDALPRLERALGDDDPGVRREAAFGLALLRRGPIGPALERAAADADASVRGAAAVAAGISRDEAHVGILEKLLADPDPSVRTEAARAAGKLDDPGFATDTLIALTAAEDPGLRSAAAYALSRIATAVPRLPGSGEQVGVSPQAREAARDHLVTLATHDEARVRLWVARGLSAPASRAESAALIALTGDVEPQVRLSAIGSMCFPGGPITVELTRLLEASDPRIVWMVLDGLGRIGGDQAGDILVDQIIHRDLLWLREKAIRALTRAKPQLGARVANGLSREVDPGVRAAAAGPLAIAGDEQAREIAARLLRDADRRVRAAAVAGFAGATEPFADALEDVIAGDEPLVRAAVARVAGQRLSVIGGSEERIAEAHAVLRRLWDGAGADPVPVVREAVLDQAARGGADPRARELLERGLAAPDRRLRVRAIRLFAEVFGEDRSDLAGAASERGLAEYVEILRWASRPRAAIVTVARPGFRPGRFSLRLATDSAPLTAWNFARLAEQGYYDGSPIYQAPPHFMVRGGDPLGDGTGGPGYAIRDEIHPDPFEAGTLGMLSTGKDLAGSQWFITLSPQPHLEGRYTVFGQVVQNLPGVVSLLRPGDSVVSVRIYEGDGTEPLP